MTDKPVTVTPELLPCRKCGAICRVETWAASEVLMTETNLWMCSESTLFDGECDGDAYVSAEAWNTRTDHAPSQHSDLADTTDLIDRLREGVTSCGLHDDNETEMFDVVDADEAMCEAADALTQQAEQIAKLRQDLAMEPLRAAIKGEEK